MIVTALNRTNADSIPNAGDEQTHLVFTCIEAIAASDREHCHEVCHAFHLICSSLRFTRRERPGFGNDHMVLFQVLVPQLKHGLPLVRMFLRQIMHLSRIVSQIE